MIHFKPFKFGWAEIITVAALVLLVLLFMGIHYYPPIDAWYTGFTEQWTEIAVRYGYTGAFLSSLVGNLTVVIIFPYTIVVYLVATSGLDPFLLGLVTGTGAVLGELSGYLIGRWGAHKFQKAKPEAFDALKKIVNARPTYVTWLLFVFSVLPLPDDVLFVPLGFLRYSLWRLLWPAWLGKVIAALVITYAGNFAYHFTDHSNVTSPMAIFNQLGALFALTIAMYLMFKLDWQKIMHRLLNGHHHTVEPVDR